MRSFGNTDHKFEIKDLPVATSAVSSPIGPTKFVAVEVVPEDSSVIVIGVGVIGVVPQVGNVIVAKGKRLKVKGVKSYPDFGSAVIQTSPPPPPDLHVGERIEVLK